MNRAAIICGALLLCAACEPTAKTSGATSSTDVANVAKSSTSAATTTTTLSVDPSLVDGCVEFTQLAAFIGDAEMIQAWEAAGQDVGVLEEQCGALPEARLVELSIRLEATEAFLAAAAATTLPPLPVTTIAPLPPVTAPPPQAAPLPFVAPPPAPVNDCNANYEGACVPNASDVDCAGGTGDGPAYVRGPVYVVGSDPYDLDRDGDGVGCQS